MTKYANIYSELLCGERIMKFTAMPKDTFEWQSKRYEVGFEEIDENLNGFISLNDIGHATGNKKTGKRLRIPLDTEITKGLDDLMILVSDFTFPEEDICFYLYDAYSKELTHIFLLSANLKYC